MNRTSVRTEYRVIYGDTDKLGIVYNANYLRWFEIGRSEIFRQLGMTYKEVEEKGIFMPVAEINCKYISPVHYDDLIIIETSIDPELKKGMTFLYKIISKDDVTLHAVGFSRHAFLNKEYKVIRPPAFIKELIY